MRFQPKMPVQVVTELVPNLAQINDLKVNGLWVANSLLEGVKNEY